MTNLIGHAIAVNPDPDRATAPRADAVRAHRATALAVLQRLLVDRARNEALLVEHNRHDAMKTATGRTVFDRLVDETQRRILELDAVIDDFDAARRRPEIVVTKGVAARMTCPSEIGTRRVTSTIA